MTVIFPKWTNRMPPLIGGGLLVLALLVVFVVDRYFSPWHTDVGYRPAQPVPYSHKVHAGIRDIDCRYCHQAVEKGPHATVPTTETCMNCHTQIRAASPRLAPLREKHAAGEPLSWVKVHMLPDYAYFSHAAHVNAGVGCASCHGRVDQMEVVRQVKPLSMGWCLECHRDPEPHLRPPDRITDMDFEPTPEARRAFYEKRGMDVPTVNPPEHCSACHR